ALVRDGRHVTLFDIATGREAWSVRGSAVSRIDGESPRLFAGSASLLVVTPSNLGPQLQRLDVETGTPVWKNTVRLADTPHDPANWADDGTTLFLTQGRRLTALTLADGKTRWDVPLTGPDGAWCVRRSVDYLLVWPQATAEGRFTFRSPLGAL